MKALDTKELKVRKRDVIAVAGEINRAAKAGQLGPFGQRMQVTYDNEWGTIWATRDTRSTWTVDNANQVSVFCEQPISTQTLLDRLAEAWQYKTECKKIWAE